MAALGRLEPFAIVSFRPETVIQGRRRERRLSDQLAVVRTTFLKPPVLTQTRQKRVHALGIEIWPKSYLRKSLLLNLGALKALDEVIHELLVTTEIEVMPSLAATVVRHSADQCVGGVA